MSKVPTIAALLLCALWLILALRLIRKDWATSPTRIWLVASATVPLAGAVAVSWLWFADAASERELTGVAHFISGNSTIVVECRPVDEYLLFNEWYVAWIDPDAVVAHLDYSVCADLATYSASGGSRANPTDEQLQSMVVLGYVVYSLDGSAESNVAVCRTVQMMHFIAEGLGATPEQAREAQARYYDEIYPTLDLEFRSHQCVAGGPMDIDARREEFP